MMLKASVYVFFTVIIVQCGFAVDGARILGIFPAPSKSHYALGNVLLKELSRRGHQVTMISPYEVENDSPNSSYTGLKLELEMSQQDKNLNFFKPGMTSPLAGILFLNYAGNKMLNTLLQKPETRELLKSNKKFDAVIMDQFIDDGLSYFAHHFGAQHILLSSTYASAWVNPLVGNPAPPSVVPQLFLPYSTDMNFFQRVHNTLFYLIDELNRQLWFFPWQNKIIKDNLPNARPMYDYLYNVSLVLLNGHESYADPVSLTPVMKNVGGFHISGSKKLPADLQKFMDDAKEGVVYFSMGSNLKTKDLPVEVRDSILRVFAKLKVKILWKWEDDELPGRPANVKLGKWFPQQEILAHPNLKVFITHGGLLSTIEAVYYGIPLLAVSVYGDQNLNAVTASQKGYAIALPYSEFEEVKFEWALNELLNNPRYKKNAEYRSKIFHDRPMKPMDEAVYWVEYVIRNGASHLRVASLNLSWYQYMLLDVTVFLLTLLGLATYIVVVVFKKLCCRKKSNQEEKISKGSKIKKN